MSLAFFQEEFFHLRFCVSRFFFRTLNEKKEKKNKLLSVTKQHTDDNTNNNNKERERERERERETTKPLFIASATKKEKRRMMRMKFFVKVSLLMAMLLQIRFVVSAHIQSDDDDFGEKMTMKKRCKNTNDAPKKQPLTFCDDYRSHTCCTSRDTDRILVHHVEMQRQSVSATCASLFGRFECSKCDARNLGGSTRNNNNSEDDDRFKVCSAYAKQLYRACKEEYFVEGAVGGGVGAGRGSSGLISSGGRLTPCKSTDAICAKLEEFSGNWKEAVEMMGAKVVGRTKKSARLEDDEDEFDDDKEEDKEEEESDDDDDQSTAAVVNEWCFDGSVPAKVFEKKPSKTDEKKKATAKGYRRLIKFRWRKFLTARYWRRDQRLVKLLFVVYAFVAALLLYKRNAAKIKLFFWKRKVEKLRANVANAAEMRMKSA